MNYVNRDGQSVMFNADRNTFFKTGTSKAFGLF